jgi:RNase P subunit RPR2
MGHFCCWGVRAELAWRGRVRGGGWLCSRRLDAHPAGDDLLTSAQSCRGLRRIVVARVDDRAREQRRLIRRQRGRRDAEIPARCGFGAEDAVSPLDHVEVQLEDSALRQRRFQTARDHQLFQLADRIARRRQVQVLRQLLRDRACAAREAPLLPVGFQRRAKLLQIDAVVLEKRCVFGHEHRTPQVTRELRVRHPPLVYGEGSTCLLRLAFSELDECGRPRVLVCERTDVRQCQIYVPDVAERQGGSDTRCAQHLSHDTILLTAGS